MPCVAVAYVDRLDGRVAVVHRQIECNQRVATQCRGI